LQHGCRSYYLAVTSLLLRRSGNPGRSGVRAVLVVPARMTRGGLLAYPRQKLSRPGGRAPARFDGIGQSWLTWFSRFLAACHPQLNDPSG